MHVSVVPFDFNWIVQVVLTAFFIFIGLLRLLKNKATKYFLVEGDFDSQGGRVAVAMDKQIRVPGVSEGVTTCSICGAHASSQCSGCKAFRYCSPVCQKVHWKSGHSKKCRELLLDMKGPGTVNYGTKPLRDSSKNNCVIANSSAQISELPKMIIFPYDVFVEHFNSSKPGFPPCGLLNCGNSCFANVVLQCLTFTPPLVSYLLGEDHRQQCKRNDWCFLCELQILVNRASRSTHPFSPLSILSRLPNIGNNFGYGKQEDAHEFMRFAIEAMQSVCLDEFGGEKGLHHSAQETSLIQHTFGGYLQSQVICSECNKISNQYENMMDLTVEIQGDVASLEDCLNQFTLKEWLQGENMYQCDICNAYVKASKCLTIHRAPNILTIALKRFQSGRFGKLNKIVSFPDNLDLSPYMSEPGHGTDMYKLYAVVVHMDMLNASFFGHYICYIKDFRENWYRVDDDKVRTVDLEEVHSQSAYMLLYTRVRARSSCLSDIESSCNSKHRIVKKTPLIHHGSECSASEDLIQNCKEDEVVSYCSTKQLVPSEINLFENDARFCNGSSSCRSSLESSEISSMENAVKTKSLFSRGFLINQLRPNNAVKKRNHFNGVTDGSSISNNSYDLLCFNNDPCLNLGNSPECGVQSCESDEAILPESGKGVYSDENLDSSSSESDNSEDMCLNLSNFEEGDNSQDALSEKGFSEYAPISDSDPPDSVNESSEKDEVVSCGSTKQHSLSQISSFENGAKFCNGSSISGKSPDSGKVWDSRKNLRRSLPERTKPMLSRGFLTNSKAKTKNCNGKSIGISRNSSSNPLSEDMCLNLSNSQITPTENRYSKYAPTSGSGYFASINVVQSAEADSLQNGICENPTKSFNGFSSQGHLPESGDKLECDIKTKPLFSRIAPTENWYSKYAPSSDSDYLAPTNVLQSAVADSLKSSISENPTKLFNGFASQAILPESGEKLERDIKMKPLISRGFLTKKGAGNNGIKTEVK